MPASLWMNASPKKLSSVRMQKYSMHLNARQMRYISMTGYQTFFLLMFSFMIPSGVQGPPAGLSVSEP